MSFIEWSTPLAPTKPSTRKSTRLTYHVSATLNIALPAALVIFPKHIAYKLKCVCSASFKLLDKDGDSEVGVDVEVMHVSVTVEARKDGLAFGESVLHGIPVMT